MGQRGPLPNLTTYAAPALADLAAPEWLSREGKAFWDRHCKNLALNNLLTTATADSFASVCDLWARLQAFRGEPTTRAYLDTEKAYRGAAKLFRLVPCDKPGTAVEHRHQDKPSFEFG